MHLWLLLSAALAFVPQRSVPLIRGLQAVVEDIDALSFRELQAACKERGLPARGATDVRMNGRTPLRVTVICAIGAANGHSRMGSIIVGGEVRLAELSLGSSLSSG